MAEIRINSKPCPNCGYRNVTGETRVCERCGTSIIKGKLLIWGGMGVLALVLLLGAGIWFSQDRKVNNTALLPKASSPIAQEVPKATPQAPVTPAEEATELEPTEFVMEEDPVTPVVNTSNKEKAPAVSTSVSSRENMPARYMQVTEGAERIISDLPVRVQSGPVAQFRSKAFEKLAETLKSPKYAGKEIYVIAFSESVGSAFIAENRAKFVRKVLRENYQVSQALFTHGFGPSAVNSRDAVRRIEVWAK